MPQRMRKLVGTIVLVVFVSLYALTAMTVAAAKLPGTSGWVQLLYFAAAGLALGLAGGAAGAMDAKAGPAGRLARPADSIPQSPRARASAASPGSAHPGRAR